MPDNDIAGYSRATWVYSLLFTSYGEKNQTIKCRSKSSLAEVNYWPLPWH